MTMIFLRSKASAVSAFTPADLFASSEKGAWYEPSTTTCFTDTAGTTAASVGDAVARINDLSGNGNHATQGTAAARPTLQQTAGGLYYLDFDGVDDGLIGAFPTITQPFSFSVGAQYRTVSGQGDLYRSQGPSAGLASDDETVSYTNAATGDDYSLFAGTVLNSGVSTSTDPHVRTDTINSGSGIIRVNGSQIASGSVGALGLSTSGATFFIGRGTLTSATPQLNVFAMLFIDRVLTAGEISDTETYLAAKSGVAL